ncbi:helix-turn-helix domain-containing protein [Kitasatospora sp. P5_F3]
MYERGERFGRLLRGQREAAALSQEELADRSGLSARAIGNLERGRSRPRAESIRRIVAALGLEGAPAAAMATAAGPLESTAGQGDRRLGQEGVPREVVSVPGGRPTAAEPEGRLSDAEALLLLEVLGGVDPSDWEPEVRTALLRACAGSSAALHLAGAVLATEPELPMRELARRLDDLYAVS